MRVCTVHARSARWPSMRLVPGILLLVAALSMITTGLASAEDPRSGSQVRSSLRGDRSALDRWREATPDERRALRDAGREKWDRATPRERRIFRRGMVGLRHAVPEFSEIERLVFLRNLFAMSKAERRTMRKRLRGIDDLEAGKRKELIDELRTIIDKPSAESRRIERNVDRWKDMSESDREKYREQMRRFRALSVDERRQLLDEWEDPKRAPRPRHAEGSAKDR